MLDMKQAAALIEQLQKADERERQPIDPALPLNLARARREVEAAFAGDHAATWLADASTTGLVEAGVAAVLGWLDRQR
jgi:hypothetical protein